MQEQESLVLQWKHSAVSITAKLLFSSLCCRIFLSLMDAAGLTDLLKQEGDFTLFAPSDMAFAGLSKSDLETLKSKLLRMSFFVFEAPQVK